MTRGWVWLKGRGWFVPVLALITVVSIWVGIRQDDVLSCQRQNPVRDSARTFFLAEVAKNDALAESTRRTNVQTRRLVKVRTGVERQVAVTAVRENLRKAQAYDRAADDAYEAAVLPDHLDCGGLFPTDR